MMVRPLDRMIAFVINRSGLSREIVEQVVHAQAAYYDPDPAEGQAPTTEAAWADEALLRASDAVNRRTGGAA